MVPDGHRIGRKLNFATYNKHIIKTTHWPVYATSANGSLLIEYRMEIIQILPVFLLHFEVSLRMETSRT